MERLVLYDGECGLCDRSVQFLLRRDKKGLLRFAPLQGQTAKPYVGDVDAFDTMIFVERIGDAVKVSRRSEAAFRILATLGGGWRVLSWLRILPRALTNFFYRIVAKNRLRWFGRADACRVPDAATRARFLV